MRTSPYSIRTTLPKISSTWAEILRPGATLSSESTDTNFNVTFRANISVSNSAMIAYMNCSGSRIALSAFDVDGKDAGSLFRRAPLADQESYLSCILASITKLPPHAFKIDKGAGTTPVDATNRLFHGGVLVALSHRFEDRCLEFVFDLTDAAVSGLAARKSLAGAADISRSLHIDFSTRLHTYRLTAQELTEMRAGDVLLSMKTINAAFDSFLVAPNMLSPQPARVHIRDSEISYTWNAQHHFQRTNVENSTVDIAADSRLQSPENFFDNQATTSINGPTAVLAQTWQLDCFMPGPRISVNDFLSLEGGHVLNLPIATDSLEVDLRLGNQVVARGQLVDVEGKLAVRLLEIYCKAKS
jgi:flagellar motor switch/type III secretory pathway protein FliN